MGIRPLSWKGWIKVLLGSLVISSIYTAYGGKVRRSGRLRRGSDGVEELVERRSFSFQVSERLARDKGNWKIIMYGGPVKVNVPRH